MPILDKLNNKLEEAGVEEHGRTIEEAVDLLPAMGGGLKLELIAEHQCDWFIKGQGSLTVKYFKLTDWLFLIAVNGGGSPFSPNGKSIAERTLDPDCPLKENDDINNTILIIPSGFSASPSREVANGSLGITNGTFCINENPTVDTIGAVFTTQLVIAKLK